MTSNADAAKAYLARGWKPVRLHGLAEDGLCTCADRTKPGHESAAGKHPVDASWQQDLLQSDAAIDEAWAGWRARNNVGVLTGAPSGMFAIDIDPDNGGFESLRMLQERYGTLESSYAQRTGSGGLHLLFAMPHDFEPTNRRGTLKDYSGIDVRGTGGQIVVAPSLSGKGAYSWLREGELLQAPDWLLELVRPAAPKAVSTPAVEPAVVAAVDDERYLRYAQTAVEGELARLVAATDAAVPAGQTYTGPPWNQTVFDVACSLIEIANSPWAPYDVETAYADVHRLAPRDEGFDDLSVNRCWTSAVSRVGATGRPAPDLKEDLLDWARVPDEPPRVLEGEVLQPRLLVGNAAVMAEFLRTSVGVGPLAGLLRRGSEIVFTPRLGEDGYVEPERGDDGPAQVQRADAGTLVALVQYRYDCRRATKDGGSEPALFPRTAAQIAVDGAGMLVNLRPLRGVVHAPTLREDGSVLTAPGYDESTGLLHLPEPGLLVPAVADSPTSADVAAATALLSRMVAGFSFRSPHDRANYLGLLLTPVLRAVAPSPYKLGAIGAPQPGAGKTLLATMLRLVHGGVFRAEVPGDDAEMSKTVTSILDVTTGPVVHFDNATGVLRSSTLAALLTSAVWEARRLGATDLVSRANDRLWVITGNNLALGGDLVRRALWVTIDPGVPEPHLRTGFDIPDLESWVRQHRGEILHALLTIARGWVVAGRPSNGRRGSDGYARWVETVDGVLSFAGVDGTFDDPSSASQEIGSDDDEWRDFLAAAFDTFGGEPWTARELLGRVAQFDGDLTRPIPLDALPAELAEKSHRSGTSGAARSLGMWLRNRAGRWAGHYCVRPGGKERDGTARWKVEAYQAAACPAGPAGSRSNPYAGANDFISAGAPVAEPELLPAEPAGNAAPWPAIAWASG